MNKIDLLQEGDTILVRDGKTFVPKGIIMFMRRYKRQNNIIDCPDYHHAGTIIEVDGVLHVAEANIKGYQIQPLLQAYSLNTWNNRIDIFRPNVPYTDAEKKAISIDAINYSLIITRYDFLNFIWWMYFLYTGLWIGKDNDRLYCSEAASELINRRRPRTFKSSQRTNPVDIAINEHLYKIA